MADRFGAMGVALPYPKGVYRFKTFEEADEWAMKHRIAAAVKRAQGVEVESADKGSEETRAPNWIRRLLKAWRK